MNTIKLLRKSGGKTASKTFAALKHQTKKWARQKNHCIFNLRCRDKGIIPGQSKHQKPYPYKEHRTNDKESADDSGQRKNKMHNKEFTTTKRCHRWKLEKHQRAGGRSRETHQSWKNGYTTHPNTNCHRQNAARYQQDSTWPSHRKTSRIKSSYQQMNWHVRKYRIRDKNHLASWKRPDYHPAIL